MKLFVLTAIEENQISMLTTYEITHSRVKEQGHFGEEEAGAGCRCLNTENTKDTEYIMSAYSAISAHSVV